VAHAALAETELLDKMPPDWRPPAAEANAMTREQLVATLREELGMLRQDLSALRSGERIGPDATVEPSVSNGAESNADHATKDKTLAYWLRINDIALSEAALQKDAESAANEANSARVFAIKGRISRFAAKSVEAVPDEGVDEAAAQFGRQLAVWFDHGGELYERAVQIWESPTASQGREKLNEDWRRAELQHRNEARLLNDKAIGVRSAISRRFRVEFPEFAKPVNPATSASPQAERSN
jgi:hypothetical protein